MSRGKFQLLINEGNRLKNEEKYKEAFDMFMKALDEIEENDEELQCYFSMIDCSIKLEELDTAKEFCYRSLSKYGEKEDFYLNLAYIAELEREFLDSFIFLNKSYNISKREHYKEGIKNKVFLWQRDLWFEYKYNYEVHNLNKAIECLEQLISLILLSKEIEFTIKEVYDTYIDLLIETKNYWKVYELKEKLIKLGVNEEIIFSLNNDEKYFSKIKASDTSREHFNLLIDYLIKKEKNDLYYLEKLKLAKEFGSQEYYGLLVKDYIDRPYEEKFRSRKNNYKREIEIYEMSLGFLGKNEQSIIDEIHKEIQEIRNTII
ncbi:hypothetical protein [Clostridium sp. 'White wine YQ']|uniref:hypothetical protein n=1 Tax=Clostridium sp. 'White wine YQ' TaxID=3027474 RepID=UPI002366E81B|nr:hypothetical protein [Clostridium sp. 'White wine YQ']MDD7793116.1 hypothetical protein [Clostridium sp. 'White wine YQ']